MSSYRCAHCGGPCGMQGHAFGEPVQFTCKEGQENDARLAAGKPLKWDFGVNVEAKGLCHVCREPLSSPHLPHDHIAIGGFDS